MVANIFRKTNFVALLLGGVCCFFVFLFSHPQGEVFFSLDALLTSATNSLTLIASLFLLLVLENKYRHFSIGSLHALSLPLALLFLPSAKIDFTALTVLFLLLLTFHNLALLKEGKNTKRALFNTQFLLSILCVVYPLFIPLFLCSLMIFVLPRFQTFSYLLLYLFPIALLLFLEITIKAFIAPSILTTAVEQKITFSEIPFSIETLLWIALIAATIVMQFTNRFKERVMGYGVANYFLLLLVLMGLFSALFISNTKLNFYTLSILPLWYVLGNFFEQSKDRTVNVIVLLMLSLKAATLFVVIN